MPSSRSRFMLKSNSSTLANGPTRALVATRRLIDESEHASYADQFRREIETQAEIRLSADAMEGRNAFLEKRAAVFTGR